MSAPSSFSRKPRAFWSSSVAGFALGLVLLLTFVVTGHGLGATGATTRFAAWLGLAVSPTSTQGNAYLGPMVNAGQSALLNAWITWEVMGVALGALVAAFMAGRFRVQFDGARSVGSGRRMLATLAGGMLAGFGARVAAGCTSGLGLSGAATLGIAAFVFLGAFFATGLVTHRLVRGI